MTHVPQERAKVRLVSGGTDGAGGTSPLGYTVLAEKMANLDGTVTFEEMIILILYLIMGLLEQLHT